MNLCESAFLNPDQVFGAFRAFTLENHHIEAEPFRHEVAYLFLVLSEISDSEAWAWASEKYYSTAKNQVLTNKKISFLIKNLELVRFQVNFPSLILRFHLSGGRRRGCYQ